MLSYIDCSNDVYKILCWIFTGQLHFNNRWKFINFIFLSKNYMKSISLSIKSSKPLQNFICNIDIPSFTKLSVNQEISWCCLNLKFYKPCYEIRIYYTILLLQMWTLWYDCSLNISLMAHTQGWIRTIQSIISVFI